MKVDSSYFRFHLSFSLEALCTVVLIYIASSYRKEKLEERYVFHERKEQT